ncbi:MAG: glutamate racemase [Clostridiales bacterium]|nr:glutamate racemase [Clostridiales bacterium]
MHSGQAIGFFDSGLGGLSVLASAKQQLPYESFIYLGDSANAPYGTKSDSEVLALSQRAVAELVKLGIKALVIACNTATGVAVQPLREQYSFPIIGLEPALKLAANTSQGGAILVMATPLTLKSQKYQQLYDQYGHRAISLPCPGLMDFVEREEFSGSALDSYLQNLFLPFQGTPLAAVVLGCTHYLFLREAITRHLPQGTPMVDSNDGVTRQLIRRLKEENLLAPQGPAGNVRLISTGGLEKAEQLARMFRLAQRLL